MLDGLWATGAEARHTVTEFPEGVALTGGVRLVLATHTYLCSGRPITTLGFSPPL